MIFILILYFDKLKWRINSKWATLGRALLNVLLASGVKVYRLRSCYRGGHFEHICCNKNKKSELMLTRWARAYSSFCSQVVLVYLYPFWHNSIFCSLKLQKNHSSFKIFIFRVQDHLRSSMLTPSKSTSLVLAMMSNLRWAKQQLFTSSLFVMLHARNYQNRSMFHGVIHKKWKWPRFLRHSELLHYYLYQ